ncbi:MAG: carboxymuconolactone decarboxylase family protein [Solirubrobacteraceae bacterium]
MASSKLPLPIIGPIGEPRLEPVPGVEGKFNGVMAWRPELLDAFFKFYAQVWTDGVLDVRVKDLARMKIARTVGCRMCQNTRFKVAEDATSEDDYLDIDDVENGAYTDAEKAALRYVETFCVGAAHVTDEMVAELRAHFSEAEIIELSVLVAAMSGFASINVALNIAPDTEELQMFDFAAPVSKPPRLPARPSNA